MHAGNESPDLVNLQFLQGRFSCQLQQDAHIVLIALCSVSRKPALVYEVRQKTADERMGRRAVPVWRWAVAIGHLQEAHHRCTDQLSQALEIECAHLGIKALRIFAGQCKQAEDAVGAQSNVRE